MKLNPNLTQQQISNEDLSKKKIWEHPWNKHMIAFDAEKELELKKPNPPTQEAVEKAKFKDKTFTWNGR